MSRRYRMMAIYGHYAGLCPEDFAGTPGDIQIGHFQSGWAWAIPIEQTRLSVGVVVPREVLTGADRESLFTASVAAIPRIQERIGAATLEGPLTTEADFAYATETLWGSGWVAVGDAAAFVDPIFSAGVYLAHVTAERAAEALDAILKGADTIDQLNTYARFYKTGYDTYARLVAEFYDNEHNFGRFYGTLPSHIEGAHVSRVLSGDFWSTDNPFLDYLRDDGNGVFDEFEPLLECPVYPHLVNPSHPEPNRSLRAENPS